jgi:CRP-like cAMP-binding protein
MSTQAQQEVPATIIDHLGKIKFFSGLPAAYLRRIADIGAEEEHIGGAVVFQEGDKGDKFYLILSGAVRISRMVPGWVRRRSRC